MMNAGEASIFERQGTLQFDRQQVPLSDLEWQRLESLLHEVSYRHIVGGDAGEGHSVHVCRFYNDIEKPMALHQHAAEISDIVMNPRMRAFYSRFTGTDRLCLRRCQANLLCKGDFIGVHKDQDSNPDYLATVVFHFDQHYQGGDFVTHDSRQGSLRYKPAARTALVNNCSIPHEVRPVESGERRTLACFLSTEFGQSRHLRHQFRLVK